MGIITETRFLDELRGLDIDPTPIMRLVSEPKSAVQFVVAGPGTGKTTTLTVRALKLMFVDGLPPASIVATTFTRRAAAELRSRILSMADTLRSSIRPDLSPDDRYAMDRLDFNQLHTGTLDSIAEDVLTEFRAAGAAPPVVVDDYYSGAIMLRQGAFPEARYKRHRIADYFEHLNGSKYGLNPKSVAALMKEVHERTLYDRVPLMSIDHDGVHRAMPLIVAAIRQYRNHLSASNQVDFALLEENFLDAIRNHHVSDFMDNVEVVLIDEYQDTNLLQERIYFELAATAMTNGGGFTVVGDDDQALYRFRGATTDLFITFPDRVQQKLDLEQPLPIFINENRRSTDEIIAFVNSFASLDSQYQPIRVAGKPVIVRKRSRFQPCPILGMFRPDMQTLSQDLASFVQAVVRGPGFQVPNGGPLIRVDSNQGSAADLVMLSSSPTEFNASGKVRLPYHLRQSLGALHPPIRVYNPRGRPLSEVESVALLLGLLLECCDPTDLGPTEINGLPRHAMTRFGEWRQAARRFILTDPAPSGPPSLGAYVQAWQDRAPMKAAQWPAALSVLQLVYDLITWIPFFQIDIEGLAFLEAVNRTVVAAGNLGFYDAELHFDSPDDFKRSLKELYWNFLVPIALDVVDVDEDLLATLPADRLGIFSIHQSKGLEFPLVIADVGSDFKINHWKQSFKRFPRDGGRTSVLEDDIRQFSPLGQPTRSGKDRAFDDLARLYFVAYSRARDVLLLTGLEASMNGIKNVATGWDRSGQWHWPGLSNLLMV